MFNQVSVVTAFPSAGTLAVPHLYSKGEEQGVWSQNYYLATNPTLNCHISTR